MIKKFRIPEVAFIVCAYPMMFIVSRKLEVSLHDWATTNCVYYGLIIFAITALIVLLFIIELVFKFYNYELQGEKLKIRQKEGIDIRELYNDNRKNGKTN